MNKEQREFYEFLMILPESVFDNWLNTASDEDLIRANEVFDIARFGKSDEAEDLTLAREVLKQFTLGANQ
jgi:hypothetical protein